MPEVQKQGFVSHNWGNGCIEKLLFAWGRSMPFSGHVKSLEGVILLGFWAGSQCRLVFFSFGCLCFSCRCIGTALGYVSRIATKEAKDVIESMLTFLGSQFTVFAKFCWEVGRHFLGCRSVSLCRAGIVLLLHWRILARLVVWLGGIVLGFRLVSRWLRNAGFSGNFSFSFPVSCVNSLNEFWKARKSGGPYHLWCIWQVQISLLSECCIAPLNSWG